MIAGSRSNGEKSRCFKTLIARIDLSPASRSDGDRLKVVMCLSPENLLFITRNYEANGMIGMYRFPRSIHRDFKARKYQCRWEEGRMTKIIWIY